MKSMGGNYSATTTMWFNFGPFLLLNHLQIPKGTMVPLMDSIQNFKIVCRCSIEFKSGDWLAHAMPF